MNKRDTVCPYCGAGCGFMPFHYKEAPVNYQVIPHLDLDARAKIPAFNITPARVEFDTELAALALNHGEIVPDKDKILAAFIYSSMLRFGWSPVVTSFGIDPPITPSDVMMMEENL